MVSIKQAIALAVFFLALSAHGEINPSRDWESSLYADHELVGKIWSSRSEEFIELEDVLSAIESASYLFLGEKHDNPDHHLLQLTVLNHLLDQGRVSTVAFEMMDSDQAPLLPQLKTQSIDTLDDLKNALAWDDDGWEWLFYGPMLHSAHKAGVRITAANINSDTISSVYSESAPAENSVVLEDNAMKQLADDIDESHCGLLPESQFPAMVRVQQARDESMAQSLRQTDSEQLGVLIAGNYHVRHDLSVPNYLLAQNKELIREQIISLSFMEVVPGESEPEAYLQQFGEYKAYDYIWFTPSISDEDYCASLRQ